MSMVKKILEGSRKIDQMKKEINLFISMMNGIIKNYVSKSPWVVFGDEKHTLEITRMFKSWSGRTWIVTIGHDGKRNADIAYSFSKLIEISPSHVVDYCYKSDGSEPLSLHNTSEVYKGLPVLLKGLVKIIPTMKYQHLDDFIKASKVRV